VQASTQGLDTSAMLCEGRYDKHLHSYPNIMIGPDRVTGKYKGWYWCPTGLWYEGVLYVNMANSY